MEGTGLGLAPMKGREPQISAASPSLPPLGRLDANNPELTPLLFQYDASKPM
jgi:hypothetical protein